MKVEAKEPPCFGSHHGQNSTIHFCRQSLSHQRRPLFTVLVSLSRIHCPPPLNKYNQRLPSACRVQIFVFVFIFILKRRKVETAATYRLPTTNQKIHKKEKKVKKKRKKEETSANIVFSLQTPRKVKETGPGRVSAERALEHAAAIRLPRERWRRRPPGGRTRWP